VISKIVIVGVLLLVLSSVAYAVGEDPAVQAGIEQSNRFLSAELSRTMKTQQDEIIKAANANNDENFRIFDSRMSSLMSDIKMKLIVGGVGAMLLAAGIVSLLIHWSTKRYSYEAYLQKVIGLQQGQLEKLERGGVQEMQQRMWTYGAPTSGLTAQGVLDQEQAGAQSGFNAWQHDSVRPGYWTPPSEDSPVAKNKNVRDWGAEPQKEVFDETTENIRDRQWQQRPSWKPM